jgi:sortase A
MLRQQPLPSDSSHGAGRRWLARLLVVAGVAMLAWSAVLGIDARVSQDAARVSLELASHPRASASSDDVIDPVNLAKPDRNVARGSPIAELLIPRVRLSAVVLHGSDTQTLRRGPGHLERTPLPGEPGNVAIAGHRDTFFRQLREVKVGDDIFLNAPSGRLHYQITWARVVGAHDVSVLEPTTDDVLTLVTCYPFWVLGPAPDRFVVRATRIEEDRARVVAPERRQASVDVAADAAQVATRATRNPEGAAPATVADDEALIRLAI